MNILILAAAQPGFNTHDGNYPLCLAEFNGKPLIQHTMQHCHSLPDPHFIVALRKEDIQNYHLDKMVMLLSSHTHIISISENTRGAACTALLASEYIDSDEELLILNSNEIIDENYLKIIQSFSERALDAGIVSFNSIHPRYSYVRLNKDNLVTEAAEKNPISSHATVGFYWFARGKDFVSAAKEMIRKDASVNDLFYICPTLNQMVLQQARIGVFSIEAQKYHPIKTERQLMQFENLKDTPCSTHA